MCEFVRVLRLTLPADPRAVADARHAVAAGLCPRQDTPTRDTAVLLVSELVTNAIRYGSPPISLEVDCEDDHAILVRVTDAAPELPQPGHPRPHDVHGRGLAIAAALSDEWGMDPHPVGKTVWFRLTNRR